MPKIILTTRNGETSEINAEVDVSIMQNIQNSGNDEIMALCGGSCSCATCHVYVEGDWFTKTGDPSATESELLEFAEGHQNNSRLSCQINMTAELDRIAIEVAPED